MQRFCREISGTSELMVINRGSHEEIDVLPGYPLANKLSGNVVDLCPVAAAGIEDFLALQAARVVFMKQHSGVCTGCSTGCSIEVEENQDRVWRLKPRENPHVNGWWMCDEGRYGYHHVHSDERQVGLRRPVHGVRANIEWATLAEELAARLTAAGRLAAVLSPHLTVEEAYLLAKYIRGFDAGAVLAVGPATDHWRKRDLQVRASPFARKSAPIAVESKQSSNILAAISPSMQPCRASTAAKFALPGSLAAIKPPWNDAASGSAIRGLRRTNRAGHVHHAVVGHRHLPSPWRIIRQNATDRTSTMPTGSPRAKWAVRPPTGQPGSKGRSFGGCLNGLGMYNSRRVLDEVAAEIPYFAVAGDEVPATGVDLKLNQLAGKTTEEMMNAK